VGNVNVTTIIISINWQLYPSDVSAYPLHISRTLHIAGECMDALCEVDGGQQGPLFYILDGGALLLERLSLTNFYNTNGGVITSLGTLVINACNMSRNHASERGGVLYATGGSLTMTNSNMTHNTAMVVCPMPAILRIWPRIYDMLHGRSKRITEEISLADRFLCAI
ncbi:hypothetical protein CYMTET_11923, partial [Cymbomonas tetramitiformis]